MKQPLSGNAPQDAPSATLDHLQSAIRKRAEEVYVRNGRAGGRDVENWVQAEHEILREMAGCQHAVVVKIDGAQYIAEYDPAASDGYTPSEFRPGDPIVLRLEGNRLLLRRPNGRYLETRVVRKIS